LPKFAQMDQKLVQSLINMLDKELPPEDAAPAAAGEEDDLDRAAAHKFKEFEMDKNDYCSVCDEYILGKGLQCMRCYFTMHPKCVDKCDEKCIAMTSIRGSRRDSDHKAEKEEVEPKKKEQPTSDETLYTEGNVYDVYTRKEVLGKGGCGVVYKVQNKKTNELFALKQMKKDAYLLDVLEREITIMKTFDHVGLIKLLEAYCDDKFIYLIMDYIAGGELFDKIAELESFSEKDAADITKQLLEALAYLHDLGCAHRDIKAENVLLVEKSGTQVKLADFGLANTLGQSAKFMSFVGTTPYMAPEVLSGASYGCGVDMWSLGVLTFVMLAGYMPFSGKTEMQEIRAIVGGQYYFDERRGWAEISNSAKHFIANLLLQDPEARYTANQALQHPWIRGRSLSGRRLGQLPSVRTMKDYQRESRRKKGGTIKDITKEKVPKGEKHKRTKKEGATNAKK